MLLSQRRNSGAHEAENSIHISALAGVEPRPGHLAAADVATRLPRTPPFSRLLRHAEGYSRTIRFLSLGFLVIHYLQEIGQWCRLYRLRLTSKSASLVWAVNLIQTAACSYPSMTDLNVEMQFSSFAWNPGSQNRPHSLSRWHVFLQSIKCKCMLIN